MSPVTLTALGVRFLLEVTSLLLMGAWAASSVDATPWRWVAAVVLPAAAATAWGVFRIPDDPKPAPVAVPGPVRLLIEAAFFGGAALALAGLGRPEAAVAFGAVVLVSYALLPARLRRLMGSA
ncbi:MAG: hypothetical protein AMXMBFR23_09320 [Chloroflexota bacterium]